MTYLTYKNAGVDIAAGDELVEKIKSFALKHKNLISGIGGFASLYSLQNYKNPVLVSSTDGVGTKLELAFSSGKHTSIGIDLVAMCVNDLITCGAKPLLFLDYFATGKLDLTTAEQVIQGIRQGCELADCLLVGGETAELPGMYETGKYDLAGFAVGVVERDEIIDGRKIKPGDAIIGIESSGLHSNGYSLARKIDVDFDLLFQPTIIYVRAIQKLLKDCQGIFGLAHITGGGIGGNLPRIFPEGIGAEIDLNSWKRPKIFSDIQILGPVSEEEMRNTFNLGIGMMVVTDPSNVDNVIKSLNSSGLKAWKVGKTISGESEVVFR